MHPIGCRVGAWNGCGALPAIRGDATLLQDVLQNLLDNATQYTSAGGRITVTASTSGDDAVISVADTGIGIPLAEQERIFERFYRVDAARSREAGGTGLGLSICKAICDRVGGSIGISNHAAGGAVVTVILPALDEPRAAALSASLKAE